MKTNNQCKVFSITGQQLLFINNLPTYPTPETLKNYSEVQDLLRIYRERKNTRIN